MHKLIRISVVAVYLFAALSGLYAVFANSEAKITLLSWFDQFGIFLIAAVFGTGSLVFTSNKNVQTRFEILSALSAGFITLILIHWLRYGQSMGVVVVTVANCVMIISLLSLKKPD